jgi:hypothetical protein
MSFFGDIGKALEGFAGGEGGQNIATHLLASVPGLDDDTKAALGQHLTQALAAHTGQDADTVADQAGTSTEEVASGDEGALQKIIAYGRQHPEILASATQAFTERNPAALEQMVPAIMGFFKG